MKSLGRKIKEIASTVLIVLLVLYILGIQFFPKQTADIVGYQFYTILTDSMEPVIPTNSLILSKVVKPGQKVEPDTIVSFHVDRLGTEAVFTHYLRKIKKDETGKERYYTKGATATRYDDYKTYREDILGTYVFHIPYLGKIVLFLQSPFALMEMVILFIFGVLYKLLWARFDAEEHLTAEGIPKSVHLRLKKIKLSDRKDKMSVSGVLCNFSEKKVLREFYIRVSLVDKKKKTVVYNLYAVKKLSPKGTFSWRLEVPWNDRIQDYAVMVYKPKKNKAQGGETLCSERGKKDI